jgi:hypothetical protein
MPEDGAETKTHETRSLATHDEAVAGRRPHDAPHDAEVPPPFGGSWARLYAAVLVNLAALVALFYLFTRAFR